MWGRTWRCEAAAAADAEDTLIGFATIGVVSGAAVILILPLAAPAYVGAVVLFLALLSIFVCRKKLKIRE